MRIRSGVLAAALPFLMLCVPVAAEVDLAGEWANRVHEDQPERGPGSMIGDFTGLPINAAARQRVATMKSRGMTLAQIKAAKPTLDYDSRFGRNPKWTGENFIEAVYASVGS